MRWLVLYLRSRSVPLALALVAGSALALGWLVSVTDDARVHDTMALLAVLAATATAAPGLAGADHDLDRTAAIAWPPRRAAHVLLAGVLIAGTVSFVHNGSVLRNVAGMGGLVALGAATLGASSAPLLPISWTLLVLPFAPPFGTPPTGPGYQVALTWMVQPAATGPATGAAVLLGAAGTVAYAIRGPR